jgi:hypothetical protein
MGVRGVRACVRACLMFEMFECMCVRVRACAVSHGDIESVSLLLSHGADACIGDNDK